MEHIEQDDQQELEHDEAEDRGDEVGPDLPELDDEPEDDDEPDEEADADEADAEPEAEPEEQSRRPRMVPHSRFNEVNNELKQEREARLRLEEELARARGGRQADQEREPAAEQQREQQKPEAYDFDAAEERYMEAVMEGDTAQAKQIRAEIRAQERAEAERAAHAVVESRRAQEDQAREQQELVRTASELYKRYPQLNGNSDEADPDLIEMTLALRNRYIANGSRPADALRQAAAKTCGAGKDDLLEDDEPTPRKTIQRNLERDRRIPPRDIGAGERSRPVDYSALSEDEFDSLSEADKRRARGDYL